MTNQKLQRRILNSIREWNLRVPLSILGPTGSGKTSSLLKHLRSHSSEIKNALLVSVDSIAAYRELDIGSSKVSGADRSDFDWRGIDLVAPTQKMTAAIFVEAVKADILKALSEKRPVVFIGGTHFYERFLVEGPSPGTVSDPDFIKELETRGSAAVYEDLKSQDSRWGEDLHLNDQFRIFRYGDLVLRQGLSYDELRAGGNSLFPQVDTLILNLERDHQEKVLGSRIEEMFQQGWLQEVESLLTRYAPDVPALLTMGYAEIVDFLLKKSIPSLDVLKEKILIRHRQLAKQQRTWLRQLA